MTQLLNLILIWARPILKNQKSPEPEYEQSWRLTAQYQASRFNPKFDLNWTWATSIRNRNQEALNIFLRERNLNPLTDQPDPESKQYLTDQKAYKTKQMMWRLENDTTGFTQLVICHLLTRIFSFYMYSLVKITWCIREAYSSCKFFFFSSMKYMNTVFLSLVQSLSLSNCSTSSR